MRSAVVSLLVATLLAVAVDAPAKEHGSDRKAKSGISLVASRGGADKPWCAPEVKELSDHVCWFDGGAQENGRRTLVVYLHGMYATTPGFQYLQQSALALHAKRHNFTLLLPTAPLTPGGYVWPGTAEAQKDSEASILATITKSKAELEKLQNKPFDEVFIAGFSSGAYYASSLALRGAIDVDGYMVFAGGASWAQAKESVAKRAPVFVGVSAADNQTAAHSRAFGGLLASLKWPSRTEERNAGHTVDWTLLAHGIGWLRTQATKPKS